MNINLIISGLDLVVTLAFAFFVLRQYTQRKKMHQLMWGIALVIWAIAVSAEMAATSGGWTGAIYRTYYGSGALLIPAWLGMGTLYLVASRKWANRILVALAALSALGVALIAVWQIDAAALANPRGSFVPLGVFPFFPIQLVLIILNIFGTIAFVGGALWSVVHFVRLHTQGDRVLSTALIAIGGFVAAGAHSLGVISGIELFRISELVAVAFIFVGFLLTLPAGNKNAASAPRPSN